jgi:hypothetical protein
MTSSATLPSAVTIGVPGRLRTSGSITRPASVRGQSSKCSTPTTVCTPRSAATGHTGAPGCGMLPSRPPVTRGTPAITSGRVDEAQMHPILALA